MMHIEIYNCKLCDLEGIYNLSNTLAQYFPKPDQFVTAIYELLLNAVEHGNLGIGYKTKTELVRQGKWREEVSRRMALPENREKVVSVELSYNDDECRLTIADQGEGFAWKEHVGRPVSAKHPNGRGLWIAFNSKFDRIMFNTQGNKVTCTARYCRWPCS